MDGIDVLRRAKELLEKGPLPEEDQEHGEYCPYCAIALAKTELDEENETGLSTSDCLRQLVCGWNFDTEEDRPLVEAKDAIGIIEQPFTKEASILELENAIHKGAT